MFDGLNLVRADKRSDGSFIDILETVVTPEPTAPSFSRVVPRGEALQPGMVEVTASDTATSAFNFLNIGTNEALGLPVAHSAIDFAPSAEPTMQSLVVRSAPQQVQAADTCKKKKKKLSARKPGWGAKQDGSSSESPTDVSDAHTALSMPPTADGEAEAALDADASAETVWLLGLTVATCATANDLSDGGGLLSGTPLRVPSSKLVTSTEPPTALTTPPKAAEIGTELLGNMHDTPIPGDLLAGGLTAESMPLPQPVSVVTRPLASGAESPSPDGLLDGLRTLSPVPTSKPAMVATTLSAIDMLSLFSINVAKTAPVPPAVSTPAPAPAASMPIASACVVSAGSSGSLLSGLTLRMPTHANTPSVANSSQSPSATARSTCVDANLLSREACTLKGVPNRPNATYSTATAAESITLSHSGCTYQASTSRTMVREADTEISELKSMRVASAVALSEVVSASGRISRMASDVAACEATQLEAMGADDFEAAEALEEPLRRSRAELRACRTRLVATDAAVAAYEEELAAVLRAALQDLGGAAVHLVRTRDDALCKVTDEHAATRRAAANTVERVAMERERIAVDAVRLEADREAVEKASAQLEGHVLHSVSADVKQRDAWTAKRDVASARVAEIRALLVEAEADEAACVAKMVYSEAKIADARSAYAKQLTRLSLRREALAEKMRVLRAARAEVVRHDDERLVQRHVAVADAATTAAALQGLHGEYREMCAVRRSRLGEWQLLKRLHEGRVYAEAAEAAAAADVAPYASEVKGVRARLDDASRGSKSVLTELSDVRAVLQDAAAKFPELIEAKRQAVESRDFRLAGRLTAEMKMLTAEVDSKKAQQMELSAEVEASSIAMLVLGRAMEEAEAARNKMQRASETHLAAALQQSIRGARAVLCLREAAADEGAANTAVEGKLVRSQLHMLEARVEKIFDSLSADMVLALGANLVRKC